MAEGPRIVVFSSLFPSSVQPGAGLFIRERMFRVARHLPLTVVSPVPWFPFQGLIRRFKPNYRPMPPRHEVQDGIDVWHPRFFAVPGLFRAWDGFMMAVCSLPRLRRLRRDFRFDLIDAHFAYPDGYAATLLGRWLKVPVTITLRGTEVPHAGDPVRRPRLIRALMGAARVFSVSDSLRQLAVSLGVPPEKTQVIGNGVDTTKFAPMARAAARSRLGLPLEAQVIVSVGALVARKGFHRVIECMPELMREYRDLHYLIVGGASPEGDMGRELRAQAAALGIVDRVHFLGPLPPSELKIPLSAADVFVLATSNEGWANVFLEAMACGLPVVTTDVGGNTEVVCDPALGRVVALGDRPGLVRAIADALAFPWDRARIISYARQNSWDARVHALLDAFAGLADVSATAENGKRRVVRSEP